MNTENTKKLFERFSFFQPDALPTETLMCFGFECEDGWFKLIWDLSEAIEKELTKLEKAQDPKEKTINLLKGKNKFRVMQVKEKFGTLRFYTNFSLDEVEKNIRVADSLSFKTCEICGQLGDLRMKKGWYKTLCEEHAKEHGYDKLAEIENDDD